MDFDEAADVEASNGVEAVGDDDGEGDEPKLSWGGVMDKVGGAIGCFGAVNVKRVAGLVEDGNVVAVGVTWHPKAIGVGTEEAGAGVGRSGTLNVNEAGREAGDDGAGEADCPNSGCGTRLPIALESDRPRALADSAGPGTPRAAGAEALDDAGEAIRGARFCMRGATARAASVAC